MVSEPDIETADDHPAELRTRDELRALLVRHDCSELQWTQRVVIQRGVIPHSHPVLTLNTRSSGDELLATYLHEQLHWRLAGCSETGPAAQATRAVWPSVPTATEGGAADEASTRLHLLVCFLEQRCLEHLLGPRRAGAIPRGHIYSWIYRQASKRADVLAEMCDRHGLWPPSLTPKLPG